MNKQCANMYEWCKSSLGDYTSLSTWDKCPPLVWEIKNSKIIVFTNTITRPEACVANSFLYRPTVFNYSMKGPSNSRVSGSSLFTPDAERNGFSILPGWYLCWPRKTACIFIWGDNGRIPALVEEVFTNWWKNVSWCWCRRHYSFVNIE